MGLFNFLKRKEDQTAPGSNGPKPSETKTANLYDIGKTEIIRNLCSVPRNERNESWQKEFLANIASAGFQCGRPQVITGQDGMEYIHLLLSDPNKAYTPFVIENMIQPLLNDGRGIVIGAAAEPDWVFSYGDIFNYAIKKEFYSANSIFQNQRAGGEILTEKARVRIGQPSEYIIPMQSRKVIREFLNSFGINPKICLMEWVDQEHKFDIVFNIIPDMFEEKEHFQQIMKLVQWFFPRHYSIVGKAEDSRFVPL